jgi:putative peptidoglycan lipid II flippase
MIQKFFNSLTQITESVRTIHQTAYVLSAFTLVSIILALLRDRIFAHTFGAGMTLDIYNAAFRIPDLLFIILGSLVSVFVVIPALTAAKEDNADHALSRTLFATSGILYIVVGFSAYVALPYALPTMYPALYARGGGEELLLLSRILLMQPLLLGLSNLAASCVQMYGRYTLFAIAPVLYNLGIIFGALLLYPKLGLAGLGWGVVIGAFFHFGIQAPFFFVNGLSNRGVGPGTFVSLRYVGRIMLSSVPRTLSLSFTSLAFLAIIAYVATLKSGSIALFTFAFNLAAAPLALIGASYSVAAFPTLSRLYRDNNHEEFVSHMLTAARHILFWSLPLTALCIVLRAHIVRAILGTGLFTWADTRIAAATFALFIISLAAQGLTLLFVRGYYAANQTLVPLFVTAFTGLASVLCAIGFASLYDRDTTFAYFLHDMLRLAPRDDASLALLALGVSVASIVGSLILVSIFSYTFAGVGKQVAKAFRDGFVGAVFAGFGAYLATLGFAQVYDLSSLTQTVFQALIAGLAGITLSSCILYIIGNREVREVYAALHGHASKLRKVRVKGVEAHTE